MLKTSILLPIFCLAAWTALVLVLVAVRRLAPGLTPKDFELGESSRVPSAVSLSNRNYMNLLEFPVLFYVICIIQFVAQPTSPYAMSLAWSYVALRMVHSLVHITYNNVLHRSVVFGLSNFVLIALWVHVGIALFRGNLAA